MSLGQKMIVTVGAFVITFITVCTVFKDDVKFILTSRAVEREYGAVTENSYFVEDHFSYVDNYEKAEFHSKSEFVNSIYYLINSGVSYSERYCAKDYEMCTQDMVSVLGDEELLSLLNNYVHPFNSFESINYPELYEGDNKIWLKFNMVYSDSEKEEIERVVDKVILENINDNMTTKEKIKAIHDYIINNATYDTEFNPEFEDDSIDSTNNLHRANTAYGVLVEGYGICSGYSDAMKIFLDKLNIVNYKISNDQHIWNLILLDEEWLHLDLTWDDPVSDKNITRDNYFLIDTDTLEKLDDGVHYFNSTIFSEAK